MSVSSQVSPIRPCRKKARLTLEEDEDQEPTTDNDLIHYKTYHQFKKLAEHPEFPTKVRLPCNKEIVHEMCKNTLRVPIDEIEGRKEAIKMIAQYKELQNVKTRKGEIVLHQPNIHLELVKFLINQCSRIDAKTNFQQTFLHLSATYLNPDMFHDLVKFLVEVKSLEDLLCDTDVDGATPLHVAVYNMDVKAETITLFREAGVGLNDKDKNEDNVLSYAVQGRRNEAYLKFLCSLGANPVASKDGTTLSQHAVNVRNIDAIRIFGEVNNFHPNAADNFILHKVLTEAEWNLTEATLHETVKAILNRCKASVLLQDGNGRTPLSLALDGPLKDKISARTVQLLRDCLAEEQVKWNRDTSNLTSQFSTGSWPSSVPIDVSLHSHHRELDDETLRPPEIEFPSDDGDFGISRCINLEGYGSSHEGQGSRSEEGTRVEIQSPQEPDVRSYQTERQSSREEVHGNCRYDNTVSAPGPSRRQNTGVTTQESAPRLGMKDDEIHRLVFETLSCSDLEERKKKLKEALEENPELLNKKAENEEETTLILCPKVHVDLLKIMIRKGADLSATTKTHNRTVLHLAAEYLEPPKFHQLVLAVEKEDPNVLNALDASGRHVLHLAVSNFDVQKKTLEIFRRCKTDFQLCDSDQENLLSYALDGKARKSFIMTLFNNYGVRPVKNKDGITLVHHAAHFSSLELMKLMIELSPEDVIALDDWDRSPLHHIAAEMRITEEHVMKAEVLLKGERVKNYLDQGPMRNLIHITVSDSSECTENEIKLKKRLIELLISCDATLLHEEWKQNSTPLECDNVHLDLLKFLIDKGCDPRHRWGNNGENFGLLHGMKHLSPEDYHSLVEFLINRNFGDVLAMPDREGKTPIHEAVSEIELDVETIEVFKKVIEDLNHVDNGGWNVLMYAVDGGRSLQFIKTLMEQGVEIKSAEDNTTVAHLAAKTGSVELLKFFINLATEATVAGKTPLHCAVESVEGDGKKLEIVDLLLSKFELAEAAPHPPTMFKILKLWVDVAGEKSEAEIGEMKEIVRKLVGLEPSFEKYLTALETLSIPS